MGRRLKLKELMDNKKGKDQDEWKVPPELKEYIEAFCD